MHDLIIIGAAAAGCSAAIYAIRRNLDVVIVSKDIGGEVALAGEVENWPGIQHISGYELAQNFYKHVQSYNVPIHEGVSVTGISQKGNTHVVHTKNIKGEEKDYETKSVIIGSGIHPRELGIAGEAELKGKGVTYCTVCDGPLFKGKTTATIGAGNSALESALMMSTIAEKVYLVTKYDPSEIGGGFPRGESILIDKVRAAKNVEIVYNADTTNINGEQMVKSFTYTDTKTNEKHTLDVQGVMVHIGFIPNSNFVDCVEKNDAKEIKVDKFCKTSCEGIYAAGDVTDIPFKQISISAGQGATAALSAIEYLNYWKPKE